MPRTLIRKFLVFILLALAVVSWQWLDERVPASTETTQPISSLRNETDYFLEGFIIRSGSDKQTLELTGDSLAHYTQTGLSSVSNPVVRLSGEKDRYWHATAASGSLSADYKFLILDGQVRITHHYPDSVDNITVKTDRVKIDTATRRLTTDSRVDILASGWAFSAFGMQALVDDSRLIFPSRVEANYAPGK